MARKGKPRKSYYKKKFFFSIRERILLHLAEYSRYENEVEAPDELTQFGIADIVRAGRSTCSKLLQEMEEQGLLYGRRAHVPSGKIRRTVYFLTPRGHMESQRIRRKVEATTVKVERPNGETDKLKVRDIPRELPIYARLVDVACHISRGVLDVEKFVARMRARRTEVEYLDAMPRLRHFFGREEEMAAIDAWWESSGSRVLVLTGLPGVGKTTLAGKAVTARREEASLFWYRFYEWSTVRDVLRRLGDFLARLHRKDLYLYVDTHEELDLSEALFLLEKNLRDQRALLVFDSYEQAAPALEEFFVAFKDLLARIEGPKALVASRTLPRFYDRADVRTRKLVREVELEGLAREAADTLLTLKNVPEPERETIYEQTGGHPLFLELLQGADEVASEDVDAFLRQEVFDRLLDVERRTLGLASVYRRPVPADALFLDADVDFVVLTSLTDQSLLKETVPGVYDLHDIVRGFFYEVQTPEQRRRHHGWAARFYESQGTPPDLVEVLEHYRLSGETEKAVDLVRERHQEILGRGFVDEFGQALERMREADLSRGDDLYVRLRQAHVEDLRGNWDRAAELYKQVAQAGADGGVPAVEAEALRLFGALEMNRGDHDAAEEALRTSLARYREREDKDGQAQTYYHLGFLQNRRYEFMEAYRSFREGYRLVEETGNRAVRADLLYAFGVNYRQRGNFQKSLSYKERALRILEETRNLRQLAKVYQGVGASQLELGETEEALANYQRSIEFARLIGDQRILGYALQNATGIYLERGMAERAEECIEEASQIFRRLGEQRKLGWSLLHRGDLHFLRNEGEEAARLWEKGIEELRRQKDLYAVAAYSLIIARLYAGTAELAEARKYLLEAERAATEMNHEALLEEISAERESLEAEAGGEPAQRRDEAPGPAPG